MAEVAPAPASALAAPAKNARKRTAKPRQNTGPSVREKILAIAGACKEKNGMSLAAFKKALAADKYDVDKNGARIRLAIKALVTKGLLVQTKGTGASGSFKLAKKPPTESKQPKTARKVSAKGRKVAAKKPSPKKPGVKKVGKKATVVKSKSPKTVKSRTGATKKSATAKSAVKAKGKAKPAKRPSAVKSKSPKSKARSGKKGGKK